MKRSRVVISACVVGAFISAFVAIYIYKVSALPLYCYGLSVNEEAAFTAAAEEWSKVNGRRIKLVFKGAEAIDGASTSRPAVFHLGAAGDTVSSKFSSLNRNLYKSLPRSIQECAQRPGTEQRDLFALPLLIDHLEFFKKDKQLPPDDEFGLYDLSAAQEVFAASKTRFAFGFDGSSDKLLLDIIGQLLASVFGETTYRDVCQLSMKGTSAANIATAVPAFSQTLSIVNTWRANGWLHPNWKDFTEQTAEELFKAHIISYSALYLSAHRRVSREILYEGSGVPFLELRGGTDRPLMTAPITAIALPATGRWQQEAERLAAFLVSVSTQELLSQVSMLAPVNLSSKAADIQARTVRDNAAIAVILQGFSRDGFLNTKQRTDFTAEVREMLR